MYSCFTLSSEKQWTHSFSAMSTWVYFIRRYFSLILISYLVSFTTEVHAQAALDFSFMDPTKDPFEANASPGTDNFCVSPPRLDNAQPKDEFLQQTRFLKGSKVEYNCLPGFIRIYNAKSYVICLDDNTWSSAGIFCQPRSCGNPGDIENGNMIAERFTFGAKVTYVCYPGYTMLSKRNYRECLADGTWSNTVPICEAMVCPPPPTITKGQLYPSKDEYVYLDTVIYSCNRKLALIGERSISCMDNGQWSANAPECRDVQCKYPNVPNAIRISGMAGPYYLNSVIKFRCPNGYHLNGSESIKCNEDSIWEPEPPKCLGICRSPPFFKDAELEEPTRENQFIEGTTLKLKCKEGFRAIPGAKNIATCKGKFWEIDDLFCKPISCGQPEPFNNGAVKDALFIFGTVATYVCNKGYKIKDRDTRNCQANGTWSLPIPECEVQTCDIPNVTAGLKYSPEKIKYQYEDTVTYTCDKGYQLRGQPTITCNHDGTWRPAQPFCIEICHQPSDLEYAKLKIRDRNSTTFFKGDKVFYDCRHGYIPTPNKPFQNYLTCLGQFKWSEPQQFCTRVSCGSPKRIDNAEYKAKDFFFDSEAIYTCNKGYQMATKNNSIKCLINKQWSTPVPQCKVQTCPPPEALKDGYYSNKKETYTYLESVTYKCNKLTVIGEASISCTAEGNWTSGAPECKAVCKSPPALEYGVIENENSTQQYFDINTTVTYKCRPGFEPDESKKRTITCSGNDKWSTPEEFCKRLSCGPPGNIDHGTVEAKDNLYGSKATYTCKPGYNMISRKNYRDCQANGMWSDEQPVCKEPICDKIWELQEETRRCTSTPDEWLKYLQVRYLYLQIENLKLDIEIKKKQLDHEKKF